MIKKRITNSTTVNNHLVA